MKVKLDENLPDRIVAGLRRHNITQEERKR